MEHARPYDIMYDLLKAPSGITSVHLLRGNAGSAKKGMDRLLTGRSQKKVGVLATGEETTEEQRSRPQRYEYMGQKCMR